MHPTAFAQDEPDTSAWPKILAALEERLPSRQALETWFRPLRARSLSRELLEIEVPNLFFVDWIQEHYLTLLGDAAASVLDARPQVRFRVCPDLEESPGPEAEVAAAATAASTATPGSGSWSNGSPRRSAGLLGFTESRLLPNYTFENFVVSSSNQLTFAACSAVAERPGRRYNPLFIYGGVGLGKTHIMHGIGHQVLQTRPDARVLYISAERFMNEMIYAIQCGRQLAFRDKYRNADVLLIDDIQFLAGKDGTQEEFFYTFGTLYEAHKQIVVTSDKPPREIQDLEERLVSRFNQGLVSDIKAPDLETRVAILMRRASHAGHPLGNEVALRIASRVRGNVRDLEGALVRLSALASLSRSPITTDLVDEVLREYATPEPPALTAERVSHACAEHFRITVEALRGKRRTSNVTLPRQIAMFLLRQHTGASLTDIGGWFRRDHTTVLYACEKIARSQIEDAGVAAALRAIREQLEIDI